MLPRLAADSMHVSPKNLPCAIKHPLNRLLQPLPILLLAILNQLLAH